MRFHRLAWTAVVFLSTNSFFGKTGFTLSNVAAEDVTTSAEGYVIPDGAENFQFEAEVNRMLDIVVNSLYTNKDVFLRELISNASDALDKIRFLALTQPGLLEEKPELEIRLEYDQEKKTLTITDSGIGMTHDDLVKNLGTVARSGTTKFLEALTDKDKPDIGNMIGKFGVGFYSTFLVSDRVTVASKHPESEKQWVWESQNGENEYHVYEDSRGNSLVRGTEITLHLKEDALDYADFAKMKDLVEHYSEFVTHPIFLRNIVTTEVEVDDDDAEISEAPKDTDEKEEGEDLDVGDDEDAIDEDTDEDEKPKKTEEVTTYEWEAVNDNPAIWARDKDTITDEEYTEFWKVLTKESHTTPARWSHFNAEGNINFKSILYLPEDIPDHYRYGNIERVEGGLKLYVRKVLISDEFELLPRYLGFIRGVVDSDDLPLNVNRETLQESKILKVIKKKLVRKALDMIKAFASGTTSKEGDEEAEAEIDADGNVITKEKDEKDDGEEDEEKEHPFVDWYDKFRTNIKMGIIEDEPNRSKLAKLLRFKSSKSDGKIRSLDEYVADMKEWQDDVYYLAGISEEQIEKSAFLERFRDAGVEVLYFTDAVDEYMVGQMRDFEGKKLTSVASENVKLKDEDQDLAKRRDKAYRQKFKPLTKWLKQIYGMNVMRVAVSKRLGSSPAIVSNSEYGSSANMERIMRAQAFGSGGNDMMSRALKVVEINPRHPFVLKLLDGCPPEGESDDAESFVVSQETEDAAWILLDMALLSGGFPIEDPQAYSERMGRFIQSSLSLDSMDLVPEIDPPEEEEEAPDIDVDNLDGLNMADFDFDNM